MNFTNFALFPNSITEFLDFLYLKF